MSVILASGKYKGRNFISLLDNNTDAMIGYYRRQKSKNPFKSLDDNSKLLIEEHIKNLEESKLPYPYISGGKYKGFCFYELLKEEDPDFINYLYKVCNRVANPIYLIFKDKKVDIRLFIEENGISTETDVINGGKYDGMRISDENFNEFKEYYYNLNNKNRKVFNSKNKRIVDLYLPKVCLCFGKYQWRDLNLLKNNKDFIGYYRNNYDKIINDSSRSYYPNKQTFMKLVSHINVDIFMGGKYDGKTIEEIDSDMDIYLNRLNDKSYNNFFKYNKRLYKLYKSYKDNKIKPVMNNNNNNNNILSKYNPDIKTILTPSNEESFITKKLIASNLKTVEENVDLYLQKNVRYIDEEDEDVDSEELDESQHYMDYLEDIEEEEECPYKEISKKEDNYHYDNISDLEGESYKDSSDYEDNNNEDEEDNFEKEEREVIIFPSN